MHEESGARSGQSILFTAFEPSGDAHAAPVIAALRRAVPDIRIFAWGGPLMAAAGATILEETCAHSAMGLKAAGRALAVRRHVRAIRRWAKLHRVAVHVPVDSPAANFPICRIMKGAGACVAHLVAPQLWAWGSWRTGKLRRLTDCVLCLLPFEEEWFSQRGIPARFIGHPRINRELDDKALAIRTTTLPAGAPRLGIFPGSRAHEVRANLPLLGKAFVELKDRHNGMTGIIAAATPELAKLVRRKLPVFPTGLHMVTGESDAVVAWSDLCLTVSGTMSMDIARQHKPMIGVYHTSFFSWILSVLLLRAKWRLLPNTIADREIVPEFIPHVAGVNGILTASNRVLLDSRIAALQSEELARVCSRFANKRPAEEAARLILRLGQKGTIA